MVSNAIAEKMKMLSTEYDRAFMVDAEKEAVIFSEMVALVIKYPELKEYYWGEHFPFSVH